MPQVSIIIPTFNCAHYLERAIESVLAQTFTDYEIIVADDGSTDNTRELIGRYDGRINYLYQTNRGLSSARNLALSKASGDLIAYVDADDMWYPHKLETQVGFLATHPECGFVHSDFTVIDEANRVTHRRFNHEPPRQVPQGACLMDLLRRCHIQIPTVVERRDCFDRAGNFDERLKNVQDYFHWISVAMNGMAIGYVDEPLAMYRRTAGSLSSSQRWVLEDLVAMFHILLRNRRLTLRCGRDGVDIIRRRLHCTQRALAYLERAAGDLDPARRRILGLIRESPLRTELYLDLLKSVVPFPIAQRLRRLRVQWQANAGSHP